MRHTISNVHRTCQCDVRQTSPSDVEKRTYVRITSDPDILETFDGTNDMEFLNVHPSKCSVDYPSLLDGTVVFTDSLIQLIDN